MSDKDSHRASNAACFLTLQNNQSIAAIIGKVTQHGNNTDFHVFEIAEQLLSIISLQTKYMIVDDIHAQSH